MTAQIQRLPNGRHIVSLLGDPGPLPDEAPVRGSQLARKAYWSEQVALRRRRLNEAQDVSTMEAEALALLVALHQWRAIDEDDAA